MSGSNNHRYGIKASQETIKKKSEAAKRLWKDEVYVENVLSAREKARELAAHPFGWDPESRNKRTETFLKIYGVPHNWSDPQVRAKCVETTKIRYGKTASEMSQDKIDFEKRRRTLIKTLTGLPYEEYERKLGEREKYYKKVRRLTEQQPLHLLENHEKRAHFTNSENPYHLDHIVPVCYGWLNEIPEEIISDISNLRFIPARDNIKKSSYYEEKFWRSSEKKIQD